MTIFHVASRGAVWVLGAQLIIGVGQFLYSAVTARIFTPTEFGGFAAALSLQTLLILVTTTGLPSIILREKTLTRADVRLVRAYALAGGAIAAIAFWLVSPPWLMILKAPNGMEYVPLLTIALVLGPIASIESSMLRREGRSVADAMTFILAFAVPSAVAVLAAVTVREAWVLALVTVLNPVILGVSSALARRMRYAGIGHMRHRELLEFAWKVTVQNTVFLLIGQVPSWAVSGLLGASSLGQYSRASTLTGTPSTSLSNALNRAIQPHWRKLADETTTANAIRDTASLTANLAFPLFALLATIGPDLSVLWLGPGWEEAGELVPWLAVAFGLQVPFGMLAGSLELRGHFGPVRVAQLGLAAGLVTGLSVFVMTRDAQMAAGAAALSQATGLLALIGAMAKTSHLRAWSLLGAFGPPLVWSIGVGLVGFIGVETAHNLSWTIIGSSEFASVIAGGVLSLLVWVATFRWQPASRVLAIRGVRLPSFMRSPGIGTAQS